MTRIVCRAPARVDLAGGSLDLWPLGLLFEGACTVNAAVGLFAEATLTRRPGPGVDLDSADLGQRYTWRAGSPPGSLRLLERYCATFGVTDGWRLSTRSGSPPGAGLGGSSALSTAVARALGAASGKEPPSDVGLVETCRDVEAQELKIPTGVQDFWPAVRGGALCLRYHPGAVEVTRLPVDLGALGARLTLVYTGLSRLSAATNWALYRNALSGEAETLEALEGIARAAREMSRALPAGEWPAAGLALAQEMAHRARLAEGIVTPEIAALFEVARQAGAWGGKVCGAGGGGCLAFLSPPEYKSGVEEALVACGARVLSAAPTETGVRLEVEP